MLRHLRAILCALREHPHEITRTYKPWPYSNEVIERCSGCGATGETFVGESYFPRRS